MLKLEDIATLQTQNIYPLYSTKKQELAINVTLCENTKTYNSRNSSKKKSKLISKHQAQNFKSAIERASYNQCPPNIHKTLNLSAMGIKDEDATDAIGYWIKLMRDWMATKGSPMTWFWVRENPIGGGSHVHLLMHLPPHLSKQLRTRQYYWLKLITEKFRTFEPRKSQGRILTRYIGGSFMTYQNNIAKFRDNLAIVIGYVLKGASNQTLNALNIHRKHECCGTVIGKRIARCQRRFNKSQKKLQNSGSYSASI